MYSIEKTQQYIKRKSHFLYMYIELSLLAIDFG